MVKYKAQYNEWFESLSEEEQKVNLSKIVNRFFANTFENF